MKIIKSDFKKGFVKLKINLIDDLWYLEGIVEVNDFVEARTLRSLFLERDGKRTKIGKIPMFLRIKVEKIEFHKHANRLRLMGKIIEGPEDVQIGSYHTIEGGVGTILTIYKEEWKKYQIERLKKAQTVIPDVLIIVVDSTQTTFGLLKRSGVGIISEFRNLHSIQEEDKLPEFYKKVATEIDKFSPKVNKIILAGPGFAKEHIQKIIKEKYPDVNEKLIIDTTSSATKAGINEILKKGTLDKVIAESEIIKESQIIQEFFLHLQKDDGLSVYGFDQIKEADNAGAVKILLVSEERIREDEIEELAREIEKKNGQIEIVSRTHDLGEQFSRMGGLGAILRFRIF